MTASGTKRTSHHVRNSRLVLSENSIRPGFACGAGRPRIDRGLRDLIRRMSLENPLWGAARIHGELLMLGFEVAQSTVSKYLTRGRRPPSQSWKTFLRNHANAIAAIDLCVVPTVTFDRLFAFLVVGHGRRQLLWLEVTRHPTVKLLKNQIRTPPTTAVSSNQRQFILFRKINVRKHDDQRR